MPLGAIGSVIGSGITAAASAAMAKRQMDFQKSMYQHRYQYQMADMRKAGLNPILSYRQAPPGAPTGANAPMPDFGRTLSSALDVSNKRKTGVNQRDLMDQQILTSASQASHSAEQAKTEKARQGLIQAETAARELDLVPKQLEADLLGVTGTGARAAAALNRVKGMSKLIPGPMGKGARVLMQRTNKRANNRRVRDLFDMGRNTAQSYRGNSAAQYRAYKARSRKFE